MTLTESGLGIVADDLTGAVDTGVQSAKAGLHAVVMLGDGELPPAEMVVINTDSRDEPAADAYRHALEAAGRLAGRLVYKKMDSTLRGNLGAEIDGMLDGLGLERALVAPAFPNTGRTTENGYHKVHGVLLSESAFARDPVWPATESHLPTILARQTRRTVGLLPLAIVEEGTAAVIEALRAEKAAVVAADAVEVRHLRTLAQALVQMGERWLPAGCAGLAEEWTAALGLSRATGGSFCWPADPRPALVVAGSRNRTTATQLQEAAGRGLLEIVDLPANGDWGDQVGVRAAGLLAQGLNVAITTTFAPYQEGQGMANAARLAEATAGLLEPRGVSGVFMTGGDIARAVCRRLGATALRALGEVQAGVPAGILVGGPVDGLRVVTKAGGFGDEMAIIESIDCLQGRLT